MDQDNEIILTVDDHDQNCVVRRLDCHTGAEQLLTLATAPEALVQLVEQAQARASCRGGRVCWVQESTTGWARVQALLGARAEFVLANVLQMPLPPKARRRKTDQIDTARIQREFLAGQLPLAHQPPLWWRQVRRLVALRESPVSRRTAVRNWINRYLAHETWADRAGWWSQQGLRRLRALTLPEPDRKLLEWRARELEQVAGQIQEVEAEMQAVYQGWPEAQRVGAIRGIGVIAAVSIVARIGPVRRFRSAEQGIALAGLAPGVQQSDQTRRQGRIGGGGTDVHLRHDRIEASVWARQLPRYRAAYERVAQRRGNKIGRLVVARLLLRGIYKVLRDGVPFNPVPAGLGLTATAQK
jgi:transposase